MTVRKIIFECRIGSHLYGLNRPDSDEDFCGVFLPSTDDLLGLRSCPKELKQDVKVSDGAKNTVGDTDRKYWSLQRFIELVTEGQPGAVEMLFAPIDSIVSISEEWPEIRDTLISCSMSSRSVRPFVGFALSQAHKAVIKGDNLNKIRELIALLEDGIRCSAAFMSLPVSDNLSKREDGEYLFDVIKLNVITNNHGFRVIDLAGRQYDVNTKTRDYYKALRELEARYGSRSEAAASSGVDHKSLMHAYRLCIEAEELLRTGRITLPLTPEDRKFLIEVRNKLRDDMDHFSILNAKIDALNLLALTTEAVPKVANWSKADELCKKVMLRHITPSIFG
jgi:predicted nucleotidyltransferase